MLSFYMMQMRPALAQFPAVEKSTLAKELFSAQISQYTKGSQAQVSNYISGV